MGAILNVMSVDEEEMEFVMIVRVMELSDVSIVRGMVEEGNMEFVMSVKGMGK